MTYSASISEASTRDPKVIPLFDTDSGISFIGLENIITAILKSPRFEQQLKELMEISIYSAHLKSVSGSIERIDDPFDSIYISDLKPDTVPTNALKSLSTLSKKIEDHSSKIIFDDDSDD